MYVKKHEHLSLVYILPIMCMWIHTLFEPLFFSHVVNFVVFHFKLFNMFSKYFLSLGKNALEFWGLSFESCLWMPQITSLHFDNSRKYGSIHHIFHWALQWNKTILMQWNQSPTYKVWAPIATNKMKSHSPSKWVLIIVLGPCS